MSNTENSRLRYLDNMSIQGTWADELIIQAVADALKVTIQIVESYQGFAPLTTVYPLQERNTSSTITVGHIDECSLRVAVPSPRGKTGGRERLRKAGTNRVM